MGESNWLTKMKGGIKVAQIPVPDFKLITGDELSVLLNKKPELREKNFVGYCSLSQTRLVFGPQAQTDNQCTSCLPEDHFIMMPLEYIDEIHPAKLRISGSISNIKSFIKRNESSKTA